MTYGSWLDGLSSPMNVGVRICQPWHSEDHGMHADGCDVECFLISTEIGFVDLEGDLSLD